MHKGLFVYNMEYVNILVSTLHLSGVPLIHAKCKTAHLCEKME